MRKGFFNLGTDDEPSSPNNHTKRKGCRACGLYTGCKTPRMPASGEGKLGIFILGEAPGKTEDIKGKQFVGDSGQDLEETLQSLGIDMREDCRIMNAVNCRPPKNQKPTATQINECRPRVLDEIKEFKPHVIILLGATAVDSLIGSKFVGRMSDLKSTSFYSEQIPDQDYGCWLCPTYHPAYFLYTDDKGTSKRWKNDLKKAVELAKNKVKLPKNLLKRQIIVIKSKEEACNYLKHIINAAKVVSFDYETTGLKPQREGHEIVCASVSTGEGTLAFPFFDDKEFRVLWKRLMMSKEIGKIGQKVDFEDGWTYQIEGYYPRNYVWDTCLGAHCINSNKPTNLKFQTYTNFGITNYDKVVDPFITGTLPGENPDSSNKFNTVKKAPIKDLLFYCGLDSLFTLELYKIQKKKLNEHQMKGMNLLLDGVGTLSKVQQQGMYLDRKRIKQTTEEISEKVKIMQEKIDESKEVNKWKLVTRKFFNVNSNTQLDKLLYQILKHERPEGKKTDEKALSKIDIPFTKNILRHRKLIKIRDTYLAQYTREINGGKIHPFFNLHIPKTFRSSSDSPNFQNVPIRNELAKMYIRQVFIPSPGNRLVEYDWKSVEVRISACYHKDPNMIKYIEDPTTDMHRDLAMDLFLTTKEKCTDVERHIGKNGFVFPAFYGSGPPEIAPNIWKEIQKTTKDHLKNSGIKHFADFKNHVEKIYKIFWEERFPIYYEWRQKTYRDYEKTGYTDLLTGFRCYAPMKWTEVINRGIQGSAFHCLLWTLINVYPEVRKISNKTSIIGQIHDSIMVDMYPPDEPEIDKLMKYWGCDKIREHWDWIIVPLAIEKEGSEIDGNWSEMRKDKEF